MGWDSSDAWFSKKDVQRDTEKRMVDSGWQVFDRASTSQGLYWLVRTKDAKNLSIYCAMVNRREKRLWLKTMHETMGPIMDDCPARLIEAADVPENDYAADFRNGCLDFENKKELDLTGKAIELRGITYRITKKQKRSWVVRDLLFNQYRLTKNDLANAVIYE